MRHIDNRMIKKIKKIKKSTDIDETINYSINLISFDLEKIKITSLCTEYETDRREKKNDGLAPQSWPLIPNHIAGYGSRVEYLIIRSSISSSPSSPWMKNLFSL